MHVSYFLKLRLAEEHYTSVRSKDKYMQETEIIYIYLQEANFTAGVSVTVKPTSVGRALQALKVP